MLANAIAGELKLPFFSVTGTELISGFSGESEHNIRSLFRQVSHSFFVPLFLYHFAFVLLQELLLILKFSFWCT